MEKSKERLEILKKIDELEKKGIFNVDVENDPPTIELKPEDYPKLKKSLAGKIKRALAYAGGRKIINGLIKSGDLIIDDIIGLENWTNQKGPVVVTCNHFSPNDSFIMQCLFEKSKRKRMFKVIREGNYTNPPCFPALFRECDVLPLSETNRHTMMAFVSACDEVIKKGWDIMVYPEAAMWWNYRKPRPFESGAFNIAVKNNVPVVPIFITMQDDKKLGGDGFPIQRHTVHVLPAIYPNETLPKQERREDLAKQNYDAWVKVYKETYKTKLTYK